MRARRSRRLPVGADLGRLLRDRFEGDALDLADALGIIVRRAPLPPLNLTVLPRLHSGGFAVAILPADVDERTRDGMLAVAVALHLDSRPGGDPLHYAAGDPLFDPRRAERARLFAIAFIGGAAVRRRSA